MPLFIEAGFYIESVLTITPGVRLSMGPDSWLEVSSGGSLKAIGTEAAQISFTSSKPTPAAGDWNGLSINGNGCNLTWCVVKHADIGVNLEVASFTLEHSILSDSTTDLNYSGAGSWTPSGTNTITTPVAP